MEYTQIQLKECDCFFAEYKDQMRPIFYIKLSTLMDLYDFEGIEKHKIFEQLQLNEIEEGEEIYILKIEDMGLPFIPVPKDVVQQMILGGELIEYLNVDKFVETYKNIYPYITKEYMDNSVNFLKYELKKTERQLQYYKIAQQLNNNNNNNNNSSDSSDSGDSDNDNDNNK
jgi:hypothetical protein